MNFDVKKNKGFLIAEVIALALLIVCLIAWRSMVAERDSSVGAFQGACDEYSSISSKYKGQPTSALSKAYKAELERIKKDAAEMKLAVKSVPLPEYTPNSFKGALKNSADHYNKLRAELNVIVPDDYGWAEYRGDVDPSESILPKLIRQYVLTTDMLDILFANGVDEILEIDRNPTGEAVISIDEEVTFDNAPSGGSRTAKSAKEAAMVDKKLYDLVPVKFSFRIPPNKLYEVLADLRNKPSFYVIGEIATTLDIVTAGDVKDPSDISEMLVVTLVANHVELL